MKLTKEREQALELIKTNNDRKPHRFSVIDKGEAKTFITAANDLAK